MVGCAIADDSVKPYTPMEKGALIAKIESCISRAMDGFAMVCINTISHNSNNWELSCNILNMDDLLCKLMELSLTCSIGRVNTGLGDQALFLTLVETDGLTTNIDADVIDAISKLFFR